MLSQLCWSRDGRVLARKIDYHRDRVSGGKKR
jgi:hypothetical protein